MENNMLQTKNLRLARVKWFDVDHNGAELDGQFAYAFLQKAGDVYFNLFDPTDNLPVLDRTPYPNVLSNGEEYGNKLRHVSGELTTGPCYVIEKVSVPEMFSGKDEISMSQLQNYILYSEKFFVDRISIIQGLEFSRRGAFFKKMLRDMKKKNQLKAFMASHEIGRKYQK